MMREADMQLGWDSIVGGPFMSSPLFGMGEKWQQMEVAQLKHVFAYCVRQLHRDDLKKFVSWLDIKVSQFKANGSMDLGDVEDKRIPTADRVERSERSAQPGIDVSTSENSTIGHSLKPGVANHKNNPVNPYLWGYQNPFSYPNGSMHEQSPIQHMLFLKEYTSLLQNPVPDSMSMQNAAMRLRFPQYPNVSKEQTEPLDFSCQDRGFIPFTSNLGDINQAKVHPSITQHVAFPDYLRQYYQHFMDNNQDLQQDSNKLKFSNSISGGNRRKKAVPKKNKYTTGSPGGKNVFDHGASKIKGVKEESPMDSGLSNSPIAFSVEKLSSSGDCNQTRNMEESPESPSAKKPKRLNGKEAFSCRLCGIAFSSEILLRTHSSCHDRNSLYYCTASQCGARFSESHLLQLHSQRVHGWNEDPTRCSDSDAEVRHKSPEELTAEDKTPREVTVEGNLLYVCGICHKGYQNKSNFKRHMRILHEHTKNHFCPNCGKGFYRSDHFKMHVKTCIRGKKNIHIKIASPLPIAASANSSSPISLSLSHSSPSSFMLDPDLKSLSPQPEVPSAFHSSLIPDRSFLCSKVTYSPPCSETFSHPDLSTDVCTKNSSLLCTAEKHDIRCP